MKIMRSIQLGQPQAQAVPKQDQMHEDHMRKELESQPMVNGRAHSYTSASASTQEITDRAEQNLPHRTHGLSNGALLGVRT